MSGLYGVDQYEAVARHVFVQVGRDAVHARLVGDAVAAAHDDPQTVVAAQFGQQGCGVVPGFFADGVLCDVFAAATAPQVFDGCFRGVENQLGSRVVGQVADAQEPDRKSVV